MLVLYRGSTSGQESTNEIYLESKSKKYLNYVALNASNAIVYQMGKYLDVGGSGSSFRSTDTLVKQHDGTYIGKNSSLITKNQKPYLIIKYKKTTELQLDTSGNLNKVYETLNNAYFLDRFFLMCNELNQKYPLNHYSFRNGFSKWKNLPGKEMEHHQFRNYADIQLKNIIDSITAIQNQYSGLHQWLIQNIPSAEYHVLKDSLMKLPLNYESGNRYFGNVVNEISKQKPEYYFMLAEDLPQHRNTIFNSFEDNKQTVASLKAVEGHDQIKKDFFKERRFGKTMPFKIIGAYVIAAGLLTLLIVTQP